MAEQETVRITVEEAERLDQEITRLREELSRAAAREGVIKEATQELIVGAMILSKRHDEDRGTSGFLNPEINKARAAIDPHSDALAEAAQEVLEILLAFDAEGLDLTFDSEDQGKILRYRALLEGREEG